MNFVAFDYLQIYLGLVLFQRLEVPKKFRKTQTAETLIEFQFYL